MPIYIALLRGINVSGQKKIKMADLKAMFEALDYSNVQTYIQSGNVVFEAETADTAELGRAIKAAIERAFSYDVPVLVLTGDMLGDIAQANPYLKRPEIDVSKLHITLLESSPAQGARHEVEAFAASLADELVIHDRAVYLHCPGGYGKTKLNNNFLERKLHVSATTRNLKTINALLDMSA